MNSAKSLHGAVPTVDIEFCNDTEHNLIGHYVDAGHSKTVILCHGYCSSSENCHYPELAIRLYNSGISSFRFDFCGSCKSEGDFYFGKFNREVEDIKCAA